MADTPRTIAQLQALFADNSTGNISPQDLRDFVVSADLGVFNVKAYGAVGDGVTDDTAAIQAAIDAAEAELGGVVFFPPYTFVVSVGDVGGGYTGAFSINTANIVMLGYAGRSIIKLEDNADVFSYLIQSSNHSTLTPGLGWDGLTFDMNKDNQSTVPHGGILMFPSVGERRYIRNCLFLNVDAVNPISTRDCHISNNGFLNVGGIADHDNSFLYLTGNCLVDGNRFEGTGKASMGSARVAIETHGTGNRVTNNIVRGFMKGVNLSGITGADQDNQVVTNNQFLDVAAGVQLWAYGGEATSFENIIISDNLIRIDQAGWEAAGASVQINGTGVLLAQDNDMPIRNLTINNNTITYKNSEAYAGKAADTTSGGIVFYSSTDQILTNLMISGNTIDSPTANGIRLHSCVFENLTVTNNLIRNPGQSLGGMSDSYRAGLLMAGSSWQAPTIANNVFVDDQVAGTMPFAINMGSVADASGGFLGGNRWWRADAGGAMYNPYAGLSTDFRMFEPQYRIGFYDTDPVAQQTGVAVSAAGIHAALVNLGLITA